MLKKLIFPIKREEWLFFGAMLLIVCLININFSVLRSMRNALVVADTGGSAAFIPYFELFGTFPASILLTWGLSRLMRFFSPRFTFSMTLLFFLTFFVIFAFWIYPYREEIHTLLENKLGFMMEFSRFKVVFTHWPDMVFYIMSELWKVALLSVIFWGFLNQNLSLEEAKRFYPPLLLGSSIGTILAGPITVFCTSLFSWEYLTLSSQRWQHSLYLLTLCLLLCGLLTLFAFNFLFKKLQLRKPAFIPRVIQNLPSGNVGASDLQQAQPFAKQSMCKHMLDAANCKDEDADDANGQILNHPGYIPSSAENFNVDKISTPGLQQAEPMSSDELCLKKKEPFSSRLLSLSSSLRYLMKSPFLSSLFLLVIAEYVCYALGELIFLETLKSKYPSPSDYCQYMGSLSFWMGVMTAFSALFLTPHLLQTYRWSRTVLITPILMVMMTFVFFFALYLGKIGLFPGSSPVMIAVILGSIHFCIGRSAKYTLFDAIKELAFIPLDQEGQIKGKLIIDGIGSRLGRGASSFLSIVLFLLMGGPGESAIFAGILAISFAFIMIPAGRFIGRELEKPSKSSASEINPYSAAPAE